MRTADRLRFWHTWQSRLLTKRNLGIAAVSVGLLGFGKASSLLTRLLLLRTGTITAAEFGLFLVAVALVALTSMLSVMGMPQGVMRYFTLMQKGEDHGKAIRGLFAYSTAIALGVGCFIAAALAGLRLLGIADAAPGLTTNVLLLALIAIPGQALLILLPWGLLAQARSMSYLIGTQLLFNGGFLACVGLRYLFVDGPAELQTIMLMYVATTWAAVVVLTTLLTHSLKDRGLLHSWQMTAPPREFFTYSSIVMGSSLSYVALSSLDRLVMDWSSVRPGHIAVYGVAFTIAALIPAVLMLMDTYASPRLSKAFAHGDFKTAGDVYQKANEGALYLASPLVIGLICIKTTLISLFGSDFQDDAVLRMTGAILVVMLVGEYLHVSLGMTARMLQLGGLPRTDAGMIIAASIVNFSLNVWLIPQHGVAGAVLATVISKLFLFGGEAWLIYRNWGIAPWSRSRIAVKLPVFASVLVALYFGLDLAGLHG